MGLKEVRQLMKKGEYRQAIDVLEKITPEDQLESKILKTELLLENGDLNKAASLAKKTLKESRAFGTNTQKLKSLINQGWVHYFHCALSELQEMIEESEKLLSSVSTDTDLKTREYQSWIHYLKGLVHYGKGELDLTLDHSQKCLTLSESTGNQHMMIKSLIGIGTMHLEAMGNQDLALDSFKRMLSIAEATGNKSDIAWAFYTLGNYHGATGDNDKKELYCEKSLDFYQELDNKNMIANLMNMLGHVHSAKEEHGLAIDYYRKALEIYQNYGRKGSVAMIYNNMGSAFAAIGDLDKAINYYKQSLNIEEELGQKGASSTSLLLISRIHTLKGELDHALDYINKSLSIVRELKNEIAIAWCLKDLSMIHALKGEPETAMAEIEQSLQVFRQVDKKDGIAYCLVQQGINHKLLGKLEQAREDLEKGLDMLKIHLSKSNISYLASHALFHLILISQELNDLKKAKYYLKEIQEVKKARTSRYVSLRARFAEAVVLKMSNRGFDIFQAQRIFQQISSEEIIDHEITMLAMLHSCELLILELKITDAGEELLHEISNLLLKISEHAKKQNSHFLVVYSYLLQARLALVEGKLSDASKLLEACLIFAGEKKIKILLDRIKKEQEQIHQEIETWEELANRNAPVKERIEQARMENYILEAKKMQEAMVHSLADDKLSNTG
ncbi:MAG: tetratricopeptide repeat protein [Candidatus Hodarchaeales archaeon]|jgi:tetratricopeptide (TPR) repeat protein